MLLNSLCEVKVNRQVGDLMLELLKALLKVVVLV